MTPAAPMDVATARRVLGRVSHAQRFPVGRFVPPVGLLGSFVRGLPELQLALRPESRSLPGVNMERLAAWIEHEVGDPTCAAAVRGAAGAAPSYVEACIAVHELLEQRLETARGIVEAAADARSASGSRTGRT
ncbi:MAG: hypothetical protein MUE90_03720 [Thermoanaerobaculales bacterium]|nr:hypothetical protein [Thermoanaerobaculales bacterium]